ncbi:MAG TPA: hypothetical protein VN578_01105 [Candidatus Binatia bacterium]|jgi:hypothetical protein|nr:hypothetical protein [Candidatus Binatia bacterium]
MCLSLAVSAGCEDCQRQLLLCVSILGGVAIEEYPDDSNVRREKQCGRVRDMVFVSVREEQRFDFANSIFTQEFKQPWSFAGIKDNDAILVTEDSSTAMADINDHQIGRGQL